MRSMRQPAVFLDKDGTLIPNLPFNVNPERIWLAPGARTALARLAGAGYRLFVVSNQPGVARGRFPEAALEAVETRLHQLLAGIGVALADFYYCPHDPEGTVPEYAHACACRKPRPGLLLQAAREHGLDLARSWFVGDILDDVEAGNRAGCRTILIDNGNETEWRQGDQRIPHFVAADFAQVAGIVLEHAGVSKASRREQTG